MRGTAARAVLAAILRRTARILYEPSPAPEEERARPWFAIDGDHTLRLDYRLDEKGIVFDLGGYKGQWASDVFARFLCTVHVFEPVPKFAAELEVRFERNPHVIVHGFGLAGADQDVELVVADDQSSAFRGGEGRTCRGRLAAIDSFLGDNAIDTVDLIKLNIEGAEYELLEHLLDSGNICTFRNLQIQFHDFVPEAVSRMSKIQERLARTHRLTFQYPFVWENWQLINCSVGSN
jgi:FkbM family methyltransferase